MRDCVHLKKLAFGSGIALAVGFTTMSCTRKNSNHHHEGHHHSAGTEDSLKTPAVKSIQLNEAEQQKVGQIFAANEALHMAFFNYDADQIVARSAELAKAMSDIENPEIAKKLEYSISRLGQIEKERPRSENNQDYHLVSMALIHLLNEYDIGDTYKAYQCPMIKMQWIQNTANLSRVHNPYAPEMPHCGELML